MDTALVPKAQTENVFKFSKPLPVTNPSLDSKSVAKNEDCFKFSQPLDVLSSKSTDGTETSSVTPPENSSTFTDFGSQFKRSQKEWECNVCMVYNTPELEKCVACDAPRKATILPPDRSFGQQFKKSADKWECDTCMIQNTQEKTKCIACETPRKGSCYKSEPDEGFKSLASKQKASKWECSACMTQNDNECIKCVCCEQGKPGEAKMSEETQSLAVSRFTFGFGNGTDRPTENDLRITAGTETENKPANKFIFGTPNLSSQLKTSKWEWDKKEKLEPFSAPPTFKFGFCNGNNAGKTIIEPQRLFHFGFKPLKPKGWECDTCLVRNKLESVKCVCCASVRPKDYKEKTLNMNSWESNNINSKLLQTASTTNIVFGSPPQGEVSSKNEFKNELDSKTREITNSTSEANNEKQLKFDSTSNTSFDVEFKSLAALQKSFKWECTTCMTQNDTDKTKCVCCEEEKPVVKTLQLKSEVKKANNIPFGFAPKETKNANPNTSTDPGFKALVDQQQASKWECDACMIQNDISLLKCACCEQVKPGEKLEVKSSLQNEVSAPKFRFGFGNGNNAPTEEDLRQKM